jgi:hypothetical protein
MIAGGKNAGPVAEMQKAALRRPSVFSVAADQRE